MHPDLTLLAKFGLPDLRFGGSQLRRYGAADNMFKLTGRYRAACHSLDVISRCSADVLGLLSELGPESTLGA